MAMIYDQILSAITVTYHTSLEKYTKVAGTNRAQIFAYDHLEISSSIKSELGPSASALSS